MSGISFYKLIKKLPSYLLWTNWSVLAGKFQNKHGCHSTAQKEAYIAVHCEDFLFKQHQKHKRTVLPPSE